ncbi:MAG: hypothetical protein ABIH65_03415 [Nanoarchaeota archaeon]
MGTRRPRTRRITIKSDRVLYPLNKKLINHMNWKNKDVVEQVPNGYFSITLINKRISENLFGDYVRAKDSLEIISGNEQKNQIEYLKICKKYPNKGSKAYKQALAKFNRYRRTEEEATGKKKIPIKKLRAKLKSLEYQKIILNEEITYLRGEIKRKIRFLKKSSSE